MKLFMLLPYKYSYSCFSYSIISKRCLYVHFVSVMVMFFITWTIVMSEVSENQLWVFDDVDGYEIKKKMFFFELRLFVFFPL